MTFTHPTGYLNQEGYSYWPAPIKLNLELRILGQREDGYHLLQTLFQLLDIGDELWIKTSEHKNINLQSNYQEVAQQDNLVYKAALYLQQISGKKLGADIKLIKKMPSGAGLGGGSSDAASTLVALNHLWGLNLSSQQLSEIGVKLGADVPVFVRGRTAWAEGIGEILSPTIVQKKHYLIVYPNCHIDTAKIFSNSSLTRDNKPIKLRASRSDEVGKQLVTEGQSLGYNAFQSLVTELYPEVKTAIDFLNQFGQAMLTGTGSSVFLTFDNEREVRKISALCKQRWLTLEASGINTSPLIELQT